MNQDNSRPRFSIRPSQRGRHRTVRSHNPGTRRRPPTPRVRVLSSITVVPPHNRELPSTSSAAPLQNITNDPRIRKPSPPVTPWATPMDLDEPPVESTWRKAPTLNPTPTTQYTEEFRIIPGEAYEPVPIIINRDIPWRLRPVDTTVRRRVRHYRNDVTDPRMHDLRVEVTPCDSMAPHHPPQPVDPRLNSPRRMDEHPRSFGPLDNLIRLLDKSYGCPRPRPRTPPEVQRPITPPEVPRAVTPPPSTQPPADTRRFSESLEALLELARMFGTFPPETTPTHRSFKRPHSSRRH